MNGRVASLLEVGTGFHPELTGRENVFLNGAILGMERRDIFRRFDEIVAFAEVEKFIDTPVKHYSSGMYVRLAFAVAAHLEPEILIVDEVLAVGDIKFQRKCLGKMEEASKIGRTVLLVSHHMASISSLCNKVILLKNGEISLQGRSEVVIEKYFRESDSSEAVFVWDVEKSKTVREDVIHFIKAYISTDSENAVGAIDVQEGFNINLLYEITFPIRGLRIGFLVRNQEGIVVCGSTTPDIDLNEQQPGIYSVKCFFPSYTLNSGRYSVLFGADSLPNFDRLFTSDYCISFDVEDAQGYGVLKEQLPGILRPKLSWRTVLH